MPKSVQNFFQILSLKNAQDFYFFDQSGEISPNLVTLGVILTKQIIYYSISYFIFDSLFLIKVMKQSLTNWYGIGMVIIKTLSTAVGI